MTHAGADAIRTGRPRSIDVAERVNGGYVYRDEFYSDSQWQAIERRREQWRAYQERKRADPEAYAQHRARVRVYQSTPQGHKIQRRANIKRQMRELQEWFAECQRKYGSLDDAAIQLLILDHEIDLQQMRSVIRARAMERRAA